MKRRFEIGYEMILLHVLLWHWLRYRFTPIILTGHFVAGMPQKREKGLLSDVIVVFFLLGRKRGKYRQIRLYRHNVYRMHVIAH